MIETEKVVKEIETKNIVKITCDIPGCNNRAGYGPPRKGIWNDDGDDFETTDVRAMLILNGRYTEYNFDVCPSCFMKKIAPLFMTANVSKL